LFLHALGLDHSMWASQRDALGGEVRVVMPDLPGFGRSRLEESVKPLDLIRRVRPAMQHRQSQQVSKQPIEE
jgi:pimeloyl-ACP methyl ester carboxylesterase